MSFRHSLDDAGETLTRHICKSPSVVLLLGSLLTVAILSSCATNGGNEGGADGFADTDATECEQDFIAAAEVNAYQDTHSDLNVTFFSCGSVEEWLSTGRATKGLGILVDRIYIQNRCRSAPAVENSPVCNDL